MLCQPSHALQELHTASSSLFDAASRTPLAALLFFLCTGDSQLLGASVDVIDVVRHSQVDISHAGAAVRSKLQCSGNWGNRSSGSSGAYAGSGHGQPVCHTHFGN